MLVLRMLADLCLVVDPAEQMSTATLVQIGHVARNALSALQDSFWWLSVRFMPTGFARYVVVIEVYVYLKRVIRYILQSNTIDVI